MRRRRKRRHRGGIAPGRLADGRRQRRCRLETRARGGRRGTTIALANKECLVCAGDFFMQRAAKAGACILPADSEHNALFQALGSGNREELVRVIITASGGPFRTWKSAEIEQATLAQALKHPNWSMGRRSPSIRVDDEQGPRGDRSLLFVRARSGRNRCAGASAVDHPRMVEFSDRSVVAQLGAPDMRTPIAHCSDGPIALSAGGAARFSPESDS